MICMSNNSLLKDVRLFSMKPELWVFTPKALFLFSI